MLLLIYTMIIQTIIHPFSIHVGTVYRYNIVTSLNIHVMVHGSYTFLWTCRAGDALEKAVIWCREHQLEFDAINDNLPEIIEMYGNNSRKITCDFYIDDKAVLPAMVNV